MAREVKVIGDKTAGDTAMRCHTSPEKFREMYQGLQDTVGIPIRVLHVVRNPYDMIATIALYNASDKREVKIEKPVRTTNSTVLSTSVMRLQKLMAL